MLSVFALMASVVVILFSAVDPLVIAIAAAVASLVVIATRWPLVGFACLIIMLITNLSFNLIEGFGLPSVAKLALPALVLLLAIRYFFYGEKPYWPWVLAVSGGGFFLVKLLSSTTALHWQVGLAVSEDYLKDFAIAFVGCAFLRYRGAFETITGTVVVTLAVLAGMGLFQYLNGEILNEFYGFSQIIDSNSRFSGPIGDPNFFCAVLVFGAPLAIHRLYNAKGFAFFGWGLALGLILFGIVATQSRGGMLSLIVGVAVLTLSMNRGQFMVTALVAVLAISTTLAGLDEDQLARINNITMVAEEEGTADPAIEGRLASWRVAWELFQDFPILGVGPGNFNLYYQDYALELDLIFRGEGRSAHSLYLEQLAETGMVGLIYFLLMLVVACVSVVRAVGYARQVSDDHHARHYAAFGAALVSYLTAMVFLHDSYPRFLLLVIGVAVELPRYAKADPAFVESMKRHSRRNS